MGNIVKKLFFTFLISLIVTNVSIFTTENDLVEGNQGDNFYSIILPGQNGLGGEDYEKNFVINTPYKRYKTLGNIRKIDLGQKNCIRHFEEQLKADNDAEDKKLIVCCVSQGTATFINWLAQLTKEEQSKVKCIILEAVLGSVNNAINHTVEKMVSNKIKYLPFARFWLPWIAKIGYFPAYNPSGKQPLSSAQNLPKNLPIIIMHATDDPQLPINDARELYLELRKQGNNNAYLIEVPTYAHFNILDYDPEKQNKIKAIQTIYRKYNLPYNKNILPDDEESDIKKFQPSSNAIRERIKNTG